MDSFEIIKQKLMDEACGNFKNKIENSEFEKPPEEETFKENAITEEAMKRALENEAKRAQMAQSAINGSYTVTETERSPLKRQEKKEDKGSESEYSWGRGYGGFSSYGSSYSSASKTESADALRQKAAKKAVEKKMDQLVDKLDSFNDNINIFDMAAKCDKQREAKALKIQSPREYDKQIQKSRFKSDLTRGILSVLKDVLENINIIGGE